MWNCKKKLALKDSFHYDFLIILTKSTKIQIKFFQELAEIQPGLNLNLFLVSDENPGWVSYKGVSYKKKVYLEGRP